MSDQDRISRFNIPTVSSRKVMRIKRNIDQGVKLIFFSDSHLATKFFSDSQCKKSWSPFLKTNKTFFFFFNAVSVLDRPSKIKFCKVDTRIGDIQRSSSPKSKMASNYRSRCVCCVLEIKQT